MDYTYEDLINAGIVKNSNGECYAKYNEKNSIVHCEGVKSERGLYRVWISNLQKMIRRGRLEEAITSMIECVETGEIFKSNVINRLAKVIVSEDIGLANPSLPIYCSKLIKKDNKQGLTNEDLLNLVYILVKSKKSRLIDNLYYYCKRNISLTFEESFLQLKKSIDENNLIDCVTHLNNCIEKSKSLNKSISIIGLKKRHQIYEVWNYILSLNKEVYEINKCLLEIYISHDKNSGRKLNMIQALLNVIYSKYIKLDEEIEIIDLEWKRNETIWPWSVSYDKHSIKEYIKLNRGSSFFFKYGAYIENKSEEEWLIKLEEKYKI